MVSRRIASLRASSRSIANDEKWTTFEGKSGRQSHSRSEALAEDAHLETKRSEGQKLIRASDDSGSLSTRRVPNGVTQAYLNVGVCNFDGIISISETRRTFYDFIRPNVNSPDRYDQKKLAAEFGQVDKSA
jgi:hypothetical protein